MSKRGTTFSNCCLTLVICFSFLSAVVSMGARERRRTVGCIPVWYYSSPSDAIALEDVKRKQSDEDVMLIDFDEFAFFIRLNSSRTLDFTKCYPGYTNIIDEPKGGTPVYFSSKEYRDTLVFCENFSCDRKTTCSGAAATGAFKTTKNIDIQNFDQAVQAFLPSSWIHTTDGLCLKKTVADCILKHNKPVAHDFGLYYTDARVRGSISELLAVPVWFYSNPSDAIALEDVKRKQSDVDIVFVDYDEFGSFIKLNSSRTLDFRKCYPGYARIIDRPKFGKPVYFSAKEFHNMQGFCEYFSCDRQTTYSGAAAKPGLASTSDGVAEPPFEFVPAIPILGGWPLETTDIFIRRHPSGWPGKQLLNQIKTLHIFLVAKAHPESKNPDYEWRISFSSIEEKLALSLRTEIRHVFIFIKLLFKSYFADVSPLSSYHLKMLLFNLVEGRRFHSWIRRSIGETALLFLHELLQCIQKRELRSFFLPKSNLLWHIPIQELVELEAKIVEFLSNPNGHISTLQSSIQIIPSFFLTNESMKFIIGEAVKAECSGRPITLQQLRSSPVYKTQNMTSRGQVMVARALLNLGFRKEAMETLKRAIYMFVQIGGTLNHWDRPRIPADFRKAFCGHNVPRDFIHPIYEALALILDNDMDRNDKYYRYSLKLLENIYTSLAAYNCSVSVYGKLTDKPYQSFRFRMRKHHKIVKGSNYDCTDLMAAENMLLESLESYDRRSKQKYLYLATCFRYTETMGLLLFMLMVVRTVFEYSAYN